MFVDDPWSLRSYDYSSDSHYADGTELGIPASTPDDFIVIVYSSFFFFIVLGLVPRPRL